MRSQWNQLQQLTAAERLILYRSAVAVPVVAASLRLRGLRATIRWLERQPILPYSAGNESVSAEKIGSIVDIVARRHPAYRATCLPQSLVLWQCLRRNSYPAELRIGVAKESDQIIGHAWVELNGRVLNDSPSVVQRFLQVDLASPIQFSLL